MQRIGIFALTLLIASSAFAQNDDIAGARAVFEGNINAIRQKNRDAYLSFYLHSPLLVKGGPTGFTTGYDDFATARGPWPESIEASDLHLTPLQPGYVYGTYRYRVRYSGTDEHTGISERLFVKTADGWKIAVTGAVDTPPGTPAPPRALIGATLIDGRGGAPVVNANVIVRDGKIDCAGTAAQCPTPPGIDITNVSGMWIAPGLIDGHVHFSQTGWADGRPDSIDVRAAHPYEKVEADLKANPERFGRSYVCSGVTSVWDVGGYPWTLRLHDRFENDSQLPNVLAAGPLMSTLDHWLNLAAERQFIVLKDAESARNGINYLAAEGSKAVKVWLIVTKDLPIEGSTPAVMAAGEEARKHNLPLIVHATGLAEAKVALRAGANVLVHSVEDREVDQEFIDLARKNGTIIIPTLTVLDGYLRMFRGVVDRKAPAVDDPNGCVDRTTLAKVAETATLDPSLVPADRMAARQQRGDRFTRVTRANLKTLVNAGIPIATGTASTATASRAMGLDKRTGTIEKGKDADLVIVGGDPSLDVANFRKIRYVVRSGVVRNIADLHALAQPQ